jgi:3-hydroxy acid dehydrogenase / malonic semialdehyde reductase
MDRSHALEGKRVLVTGAAGGVGRAVTERMTAEGAHVLMADRPNSGVEAIASALDGSVPGHVYWFEDDLTQAAAVDAMFRRVDERLGGLDMLVACAGVGSGPLMEMADDEWRYVIEANLLSYVACTQGAIQRIRKAGHDEGMVILVGSISVHIKAVGESVYNAAKGGVASFAETLRKELMHENIRLTLIEPGAIGSAMQPFPKEVRNKMVSEHKMLAPEHVADAILFAATRPVGVDVVTLRIEPQIQKIA